MRASQIELGNGVRIPILYEDRAMLAIDKPAGWMLVPVSWQRTGLNLQAALMSSLAAGAFWARSRGLRFLRYVHRLDAETTGILLLGRSPGAVEALGALFETRRVVKTYLAVVHGTPPKPAWDCRLPLAPDPQAIGRMRVDRREGKPAETAFRVLAAGAGPDGRPIALIEAQPTTGRTHQIRVHLAASGLPVAGDPLYAAQPAAGAGARRATPTEVPRGRPPSRAVPTAHCRPGDHLPVAGSRKSGSAGPPPFPMGLRAVRLEFANPFTRRPVRIEAQTGPFLEAYGFAAGTGLADPSNLPAQAMKYFMLERSSWPPSC
jgi:RluA family pseudouridine synthase